MPTTKPGDSHNPSTTGMAPSSWGDEVNLAIEELIDRERLMIVSFVMGTSSYVTWGAANRYPVRQLSSGMNALATWSMPANFDSLTAVYLVFGANATESGTIDLRANWAAHDEAESTHSGADLNHALSLTASDVYREPITDVFSGINAGDNVGFRVDSDDVHIKLMHVAIYYRAN